MDEAKIEKWQTAKREYFRHEGGAETQCPVCIEMCHVSLDIIPDLISEHERNRVFREIVQHVVNHARHGINVDGTRRKDDWVTVTKENYPERAEAVGQNWNALLALAEKALEATP